MKAHSSVRNRIFHWLDRLQPSESVILGGAALLVGLTGGAGVGLFKQAINLTHQLVFNDLNESLTIYGAWGVVLLPAIGGLVVGFILQLFIGEERHHGVAGIIESVALAGGRLRYRRTPAKAAAAALAIGSGASVGPEDPSVQIGANLGSMFGQWLHLSDERVRALVAAGAAAGIAAAFNAPIAGVFFALEVVLGEIGGNALGVVVIAAVVSAVFTQAVSGIQPAFHVPAYAMSSFWELPLYLGLGLLAGPIAALYVRALYLLQDWFRQWRAPRWLKPAAAGVVVGLVGLFFPQIFGVGYGTIEDILGGEQFTFGLLCLLLLAKVAITAVSIGGGFPGGVFAPSLFLGATLGAAYAMGLEGFIPTLNIAPAAFAMVGMAAVLAGAVHAPLTASILLFEMTNDYRIILPLMFAVVVGMLLSQWLQRDSVYTLALTRKGIRIQRGRDVDVLEAITVDEVMDTEVATLQESDTWGEAFNKLMSLRYHGMPVVNAAGALVGIVTIQDIERAQAENGEHLSGTVGEICSRALLLTYPDDTLGAALQKMSVRDIGRLPVVARHDPGHLLGVLRRTDVIRAYNIALTRRAVLWHRAQQVRLGAMGNVNVEEIIIETNAPCVGKLVSEVHWPDACVIATLRRGSDLIIPRGDTVLCAGDRLAVVANEAAREAVEYICRSAMDAEEKETPTVRN